MLYTIFWLSLLVLFEALALTSIKKYSVENQQIYLATSIFCYAVIPLLLYKLLQKKLGISVLNIIWNIMSTLYGLFIGIIIFNETITLQQKIGVILGIIGTMLIIWNAE